MNIGFFSSKIIDGRKISEALNLETKKSISEIKEDLNFKLIPKLVLILVGNDEASLIYTNNKKKKAQELGILSENIILPESTTQEELHLLIENLSLDVHVHGILLQMPLPKHLSSFEAIKRIVPEKDVDGFHPWNVGLLNIGQQNGLVPCTPQACLYLLKTIFKSLASKNVLIIGRSNIVGWPLSKLLINENCVVTVAHSFAVDLKQLCLQNEIIISAVGKANLIQKEMVKPDHVIIDVGINRIKSNLEPSQTRIVGDADFDSILPIVSKITPVPGGVGPMTIAFLMMNVLRAFCKQNGINFN